jgi:hypothetical protein
MLTLKFHNEHDDEWEVIAGIRYAVRSDGGGGRNVTIWDVSGVIATVCVSPDMSDWSVCYVVNGMGNTVDRIRPDTHD